jgi:hypothetical protein
MDCRHGAHQVAQKSRTTTFPLNWERVISFPSRVLRVKSGAKPEEVFFSSAQFEKRKIPMTHRTKREIFTREDGFTFMNPKFDFQDSDS